MERQPIGAAAVLGAAIGLGIAIAGLSVGAALRDARAAQRFVTVRGLAEREVDADLAVWPVVFKVGADDLVELQRRVDQKREVVVAFLTSAGFPREALGFSAPRIEEGGEERSDRAAAKPRYSARAAVTVRTRDVQAVRKHMERTGELVAKGVMVLSSYDDRPQFLFTGLNSVKPAMIEQATVAAREAAAKFAKDSGSRVGKIRSASQGLFSVSDADSNVPERKLVRVVSTVEYLLED
jgi:hypothetical protein